MYMYIQYNMYIQYESKKFEAAYDIPSDGSEFIGGKEFLSEGKKK